MSNVRVIGASSAAEFRGGDSRVVVVVLVAAWAAHRVVVVGVSMAGVAWALLAVVLMAAELPMVAVVVSMVVEDLANKNSNFLISNKATT